VSPTSEIVMRNVASKVAEVGSSSTPVPLCAMLLHSIVVSGVVLMSYVTLKHKLKLECKYQTYF
jgi:hypothetical protein